MDTTPTGAHDCPPTPKGLPDFESAGSVWVTADEVAELPLRTPEALRWIRYVEDGNPIYPLSCLSREGAPPPGVVLRP